jgi:hypothetical protein
VIPVTTTSSTIPQGLDLTEGLVHGLAAAGAGDLQLTSPQAECVAPKWIAALGEDAITADGITPESLAASDLDFSGLHPTSAQGTALIDALSACHVSARRLLVGALGHDQEQAQKDCLAQEIDDAFAAKLLVSGLTSGTLHVDLQNQLDLIAEGCGVR